MEVSEVRVKGMKTDRGMILRDHDIFAEQRVAGPEIF